MTGPIGEEEVLALAAYGLTGSLVEPLRGPFGPGEWLAVVSTCRDRGLVGLLAAAVAAGDVEVTPAQLDELDVIENEVSGLVLLLEQRVGRLSGLLAAAGAEHRLVGGLARARLGYRAPGLRDVERGAVLASPDGARLAGEVLGSNLVAVDTSLGASWEIGVADVHEPPVEVEVGGRRVPSLSLEEHLVHACMEVEAAPSVAAERDVAELALCSDLVAERLPAVAAAWGATATVSQMLARVWQRFQLADRTWLSVWASRAAAPEAERSTIPAGLPALSGHAVLTRWAKDVRTRSRWRLS